MLISINDEQNPFLSTFFVLIEKLPFFSCFSSFFHIFSSLKMTTYVQDLHTPNKHSNSFLIIFIEINSKDPNEIIIQLKFYPINILCACYFIRLSKAAIDSPFNSHINSSLLLDISVVCQSPLQQPLQSLLNNVAVIFNFED